MTLEELQILGAYEIENFYEVDFSIKNAQPMCERLKIKNSSQLYRYFLPLFGAEIETREHFFVVLMNQANQVVGSYKLSTGGLSACLVDLRVLFFVVVRSLATSIAICHNHPSGNLVASDQDKKLTQKIKTACAFLDINFLDHLIVTADGYLSFADEGI